MSRSAREREPGPGAKRRPPSLWLIMAILSSVQFGMTMYIPSLPAIAEDFGTSAAAATLTLTVYLAFFAVSQLIVGPLSDRYGRRPLILIGLALFVAGSYACALAPTIDMLIVGRAVQATGACGVFAVIRAMVRDMYSREESARAMSLLGVAIGVTPALGPVLGGKLQVWFGWTASFYFMAAIATVAFVAALMLLGETMRHTAKARLDPIAIVRSYASLLGQRLFMAYSLSMGFSTGTFQAFIAGSPIVLISLLGLPPDEFALYMLVWPLAYTVGNYVSSRLTMRLGIDRLLVIGNVVTLASAAVMAGLALGGIFSVAAIIVPSLFIGIGNGLVSPNGLAGAVSERPDIAGAASALAGFIQIALGAAVTVVVGLMHQDTQVPWTLIIFASAAAGMVVCAMLRPRGPRDEAPS